MQRLFELVFRKLQILWLGQGCGVWPSSVIFGVPGTRLIPGLLSIV